MKDFFENKCDIVCDLLPVYIDGCCSEQTKEEVKAHLASCPKCKERYNSMKKPLKRKIVDAIPDSVPNFSVISTRLRHHRVLKNSFFAVAVVTAVASTVILAITHD